MLLELQHVIKRFHDKELLHIPVWQIHQGQRIGLIGANGCGKTTLLRILQGVCVVEEGVVRRFCTLSYFEQLSQQVSYGDGRLLRELSVSHLQSKKQVSGGEQQRLRLSKALSTPCHLYLLDEPTSNLDQQGIAFVKKALQNMDSFVLVTHERSLLQEVCNRSLKLRMAGCTYMKVIMKAIFIRKRNIENICSTVTIQSRSSVTSCKRRMSKK